MEALRKQREEYTLAKNKLMLRITTAEAWALNGEGLLQRRPAGVAGQEVVAGVECAANEGAVLSIFLAPFSFIIWTIPVGIANERMQNDTIAPS